MPLNASFLSRGKARGRVLHSSCRTRRTGYTAPANSATGKGHLHNLHPKMDTNLAHKYLQLPTMASKSCKTPNLRRIYKNLREFTPPFERFTKIYVIYSVNCSGPPAPPPFVTGLWLCGHTPHFLQPLPTGSGCSKSQPTSVAFRNPTRIWHWRSNQTCLRSFVFATSVPQVGWPQLRLVHATKEPVILLQPRACCGRL